MYILTHIFFIPAGVFADDECVGVSPFQKCRRHLPVETIMGIEIVPDKEELLSICP